MQIVWEYRQLLLGGVRITLIVTVLAAVVAVLMSFASGLARESRHRILRVPAIIYVELFRGTSLLAQLFWLFFVLPSFGIELPALACGVLAIGLCNGAYGSEIVRGALRSVPRGQREAAIALNYSPAQSFRLIVLPQAARVMAPLFGSLFIEILKASSLVSLITLPDLTFQAKNIILVHLNTTAVLSTVLVVYFVIALFISGGAQRIERALSRGVDHTAG
ncbi:ectoine/hydroxyectoine ABC transporter permease subunit EhuC [Ancylobacter sonchi]|uniref:ectoine/hydroxyectoine ABC transporter permease subunit EhuC n=1 Tax=Ancylobacter sonchi TaxID=1937790 RepID=UPI001BD39B28|nr:ectoine/hydroxyectoine ABC transporter permease subunit EhuC [Ancylobacter sonchi]MBS7534148.1 ectoine/hydroxyectoine ABC transporter permease subunit EhuC [Ancylobacter sonchi]